VEPSKVYPFKQWKLNGGNVETNFFLLFLIRSNAWVYGRVPLTLTFQKEVGERMVAEIGATDRCRLSVMCQYLCKVTHKFTIPGINYY